MTFLLETICIHLLNDAHFQPTPLSSHFSCLMLMQISMSSIMKRFCITMGECSSWCFASVFVYLQHWLHVRTNTPRDALCESISV